MKKLIFVAITSFANISFVFNSNKKIDCYFSNNRDCRKKIVDLIDNSKKSLYIASYVFTDQEIVKALFRAKDRGVDVKVITDKKELTDSLAKLIKDLKRKKIGYRGIKMQRGIMHHKFIIIDNSILLNGSYNLTFSANNFNYENFLLIRDKKVISEFLIEFFRMWN